MAIFNIFSASTNLLSFSMAITFSAPFKNIDLVKLPGPGPISIIVLFFIPSLKLIILLVRFKSSI